MSGNEIQTSKKKLPVADNPDMCRQNSQYLQLSDDPCVNETILLLTKLIERGKLDTNNIAYSVFKDTLKWHGQTNSSQMRYSDNTKEFSGQDVGSLVENLSASCGDSPTPPLIIIWPFP